MYHRQGYGMPPQRSNAVPIPIPNNNNNNSNNNNNNNAHHPAAAAARTPTTPQNTPPQPSWGGGVGGGVSGGVGGGVSGENTAVNNIAGTPPQRLPPHIHTAGVASGPGFFPPTPTGTTPSRLSVPLPTLASSPLSTSPPTARFMRQGTQGPPIRMPPAAAAYPPYTNPPTSVPYAGVGQGSAVLDARPPVQEKDVPMTLYAFGDNTRGTLAFAPDEGSELLCIPALVEVFEGASIRTLSVGSAGRAAAITSDGLVHLWGGGDVSDLVEGGEKGVQKGVNFAAWMPWALPVPSALPASASAVRVSVGRDHTAVVLSTGHLVTLGDGSSGQLGHGDVESRNVPRVVSSLTNQSVSFVACGDDHTVCLTATGDVYAFGRNDRGQLGIGSTESTAIPTRVRLGEGVPIVGISCGSNHTMLWDVDGNVFACGDASAGQLGLGGETTAYVLSPTLVKGLENKRVVRVCCGGNMTVALGSSGRVYACGSGVTEYETFTPTQVDLEGRRAVELCVGTDFCLAACTDGHVVGWGTNYAGVLGVAVPIGTTTYTPVVVRVIPGKTLVLLCGGGRSVFCAVSSDESSEDSDGHDDTMNMAFARPRVPIVTLDIDTFAELLEEGRVSHGDYSSLIHTIEVVFSSPACLNASFLARGHSKSLRHKHSPGLDLCGLDQFYYVTQALLPSVANTINSAILQLWVSLEPPADTLVRGAYRVFHVLMLGLGPALSSLNVFRPALHAAAELYDGLHPRVQELFVHWFSEYPKEAFERIVSLLLLYIDTYLLRGWTNFDDFENVVRLLGALYRANRVGRKLPFSSFYSDAVNRAGAVNLLRDYDMWKSDIIRSESSVPNEFSFCAYPFLINAVNKTAILQHEASMARFHEYGEAVLANVFSVQKTKPHLNLKVRRSHLIADTIDGLVQLSGEYRKPLKIEFAGEPGQDEGGLRKEFFQLLVRELFDVGYGMFKYEEDTGVYMFDPLSLAPPAEFQLIGILLGLAIYNGIILNVAFPAVVYKKLMGEATTFEDFCDTYPTAGRSLQQLLEYEGDVENTFCLTFSVSYNYYGESRTHELAPGGADIPVTNRNRAEYVERYVAYVLQDSIKEQFDAFRFGFYQVCGTAAFRLLSPEELELAICGAPVVDFEELRAFTEYAGYNADDDVIKMFWEVVLEFTPEEKAQLLKFATGTDRIPIGGFRLVRFTIEKPSGSQNDPARLPSSHTCFNVLVLPEYESVEVMADRLRKAIAYSEGFGEV